MEIVRKILSAASVKATAADRVKAGTAARVSTTGAKTDVQEFAELVKDGGYIVIKCDYDLGGEVVTLPKGTTLDFYAGMIHNGVIVGTESTIVATRRVFDEVLLSGTWTCAGNVLWFAECSDVETLGTGACFIPKRRDATRQIQLALSSSFRELVFPCAAFYITDTLTLRNEMHIVMLGTQMKQGIEHCNATIKGTAIVFTDRNITMLRIAVREGLPTNQNTVCIEGGNFDTSLCTDYTANCIEVRTDGGEKMWGVTINTTVIGRYNNTRGVGINLNPVEDRANGGYVTQIRIGSCVHSFGVGIKATTYMDWSTGECYNWLSDVQIDSNIINCPQAVDCNADCAIAGMIQAGYFWTDQENDVPLIRVGGDRADISTNIFDIRLQSNGKWANWTALDITHANAAVVASGIFRGFMALAKMMKMDIVTGHTEKFIC